MDSDVGVRLDSALCWARPRAAPARPMALCWARPRAAPARPRAAAALSASLASDHGLTELLVLLRAAEEDGELTTSYDDLATATAAAEQQSQTSRSQVLTI